MPDPRLAELERRLSSLSHNEEAVQAVQAFSAALGGTIARLAVWNEAQAIVRHPIEQNEAIVHGFDTLDDVFTLLQGDVVRTEAGYFLGERVGGHPKYAVLNSSCDLVPGRRTYAALLRIVEIRRDEERAKDKLGTLLKFTRRDAMYLPVLPDDASDVVGNAILFDGIAQVRASELLLAHRVASLSLVGWRIFASLARVAIARANPREALLRAAVDRRE